MYRAKDLGGARYATFDGALRARLLERAQLEKDLRHALERDGFELHYQPLVCLRDEQTIGFEALVRWRHPTRGLLGPDTFIAIAEETGLIVPIGSWLLRAVCAQLARWPERIHISANVSAVQIAPTLVAEVGELIDRHGLTPHRLVLEITESLVLDPLAKPPSPTSAASVSASRSTTSAPATPLSDPCSAFRSTSSNSTAPSPAPCWSPAAPR